MGVYPRSDTASRVYTPSTPFSGPRCFLKMPPTDSHITNSTLPSKTLRLVVLGANGNSGRQFVTQALEKGHRVVALVRSPEKMGVQHENLTVKKCENVESREALTPHFKDTDAVVSCLGRPIPQKFWGKETFLYDSIRAIVPAMRMAKVNRLVSMSSWYLDTKDPDIPTFIKWVSIPFLFGKLIDDHYEMEKYVNRECPDINYT